MINFLTDMAKGAAIAGAAQVAHSTLNTPLTIIAIVVGFGAMVAAMKTIWREVIAPPTKVLHQLELMMKLLQGDEDTPGLVERLNELEKCTGEISAQLTAGDRRFDKIDALLDIAASDERAQLKDILRRVQSGELFRPANDGD